MNTEQKSTATKTRAAEAETNAVLRAKLAAAQAQINALRVTTPNPEDKLAEAFAKEFIESFSLTRLITKGFLAFAWGYTLSIAGGFVVEAILLLSMPAWLQMVAAIFVLVATIYVAIVTVNPVIDTVYDASVGVAQFTKRRVNDLLGWFKRAGDDIRDKRVELRGAVRVRGAAKA